MKIRTVLSAGAALFCLLVLMIGVAAAGSPEPAAISRPDPSATGVISDTVAQVEAGRLLYDEHCLSCHGDRGQGLTEEWAETWEHEHSDCWASGCHSGRESGESFWFDGSVPAVLDTPKGLDHFSTVKSLFVYLRHTQPPQSPGDLADEEYWALTAFLLDGNGRSPEAVLPAEGAAGGVSIGLIAAGAAGFVVVTVLLWWVVRRLQS